ncbi:acyclic terpene utilization AtuA family protein [Acuticoccus kandeliae]|uniref:acyclic terpene utilization AtuA family protein n=1 Tax=Acuticoccus kandeliae TaxID=2073160 RepID=UPI000D3E26EF|nr:acyclic terpene utilization AtuA family protein [Acuticoccus kandeliae]
MNTITVLTPTGTLGYGFGDEALARGLAMGADVIAVDAGSTDPGPHYLGSGETLVSRFSTKKELRKLIRAGREKNIPLVVGSAGGAGTKAHVDWTADIVREIAREDGLHFKLATIYSDVPIERAKAAVRAGEVEDFEAGFELTEGLLDETVSLVAQMGFEPIDAALKAGADVVIAGRACDDCTIAAFPISKGGDVANAIHMGKILECGAFSAEPFAMDVMLGILGPDHFHLEPGSEKRRASIASVAAHSLYERENPYKQAGPGHVLDLEKCAFEQAGERRVKVTGAVSHDTPDYWVKLEGARIIGYRSICVAGIRCPSMMPVLDEILEETRAAVVEYFEDPTLKVLFHVYGRDGVMGALEPEAGQRGHEIGLVIETIAGDQELAHAACHNASGRLLHLHYENQYNTSGNLAFLYSPSEIDAGPAYVFSAYHLMKLTGPMEIFPTRIEDL